MEMHNDCILFICDAIRRGSPGSPGLFYYLEPLYAQLCILLGLGNLLNATFEEKLSLDNFQHLVDQAR